MLDILDAERPAGRHRVKQFAQPVGELLRAGAGALHQPGEQPVGQQAGVLREQTEQQPHQKMRRLLRVVAPAAQTLRQPGELRRRPLGDAGAGEGGSQPLRLGEQRSQHLQRRQRRCCGRGRCRQVGQGEGVRPLGRAGEVGMHLESVQVAHHQQRRVVKILAVLQQLLIGGGQVLALALVLPAEMVLEPDIGPAVAAAALGRPLLKAEEGAALVGGGRSRLAEHVAQVNEMRLRGAALGEGAALPAGDELGQCEAHGGRRSKQESGDGAHRQYSGP